MAELVDAFDLRSNVSIGVWVRVPHSLDEKKMKQQITQPTTIQIIKFKKEKRCCLCCGKTFEIEPYVVQDFCDRCYPIVCRAVFNDFNSNLTCTELINKIKKEISKVL